MIPSGFSTTTKQRLLWQTMSFMEDRTWEGPTLQFKRKDVSRAVNRKRTLWEHRNVDLLKDYFKVEHEHVLLAVKDKASVDRAITEMEPELEATLKLMFLSVARSQHAWVRQHLIRKAKADPFEARVQEYLKKYAAARVTGISEVTREKLRKAIAAGAEAGESVAEIASRIDGLYLEELIPNRSMTIARTETGIASNWASFKAAEDTGVEMQKEWAANMDDRVRDDHADADGQVVEMSEPFDVGGESLMFPQDPIGSAENIINCRCWMLYHV